MVGKGPREKKPRRWEPETIPSASGRPARRKIELLSFY